jgi:hypothetical protein
MFRRECSRREIDGLETAAMISVIAISDWTARPRAAKDAREKESAALSREGGHGTSRQSNRRQ